MANGVGADAKSPVLAATPAQQHGIERYRARWAWLLLAPMLVLLLAIAGWPLARTAWFSFTDAQLSQLEPVTMSEVGTKLDLARAYMDMGDPDGARNILQEVLAEGSASQKQEARRLIDTLPGA